MPAWRRTALLRTCGSRHMDFDFLPHVTSFPVQTSDAVKAFIRHTMINCPVRNAPANFLVCASTLGRFRRCHANVTLQTRASKEELVHFAFEYWYWSSETRGSVDLCLADSARVRCRSRLSEGNKLTTYHLIDLRVKCHDCPSRLITQVPVKFLQVVAFRSTFRSPPSPFDYSSAGSVWRASDSREHRRPPA